MTKWIDVHTHLNFLKQPVEQSIDEASAAGVERIITIGTEPDDLLVVLEIAEKYFPVVACTLGIHPHEAKKCDDSVLKLIRTRATQKEVVAIGEIGLDYHYMMSEKDIQLKVFRQHLEMAEELKMPVQVHTRDAESDTEELVREFNGRVRGIFHCFTGSLDLAKVALDCGWNVSFSGIVTFKNADDLREVARYVPLDRLHVETDAPFLTPMPHRGKPNFPARVVHTAELIADIKQVSMEDLSQQTKKNALNMFPKLSWA